MPECRYGGCEKDAMEGREHCIRHEPGEKNVAEFYGLVSEKIDRGDYDFLGYVFPEKVGFWKAKFRGQANFMDAEFQGDANFMDAEFQGDAIFMGAKFQGDAKFRGARFQGYANFGGAEFQGVADFTGAKFQGDASFMRAKFQSDAFFMRAKFQSDAIFEGAEFKQRTVFDPVRCEGMLVLADATFGSPLDEAVACRLAQVTYRRFGDEDTAAEYYLRKKRAETRAKKWYGKCLGILLDALCEYGETPVRVLYWMAGIIFGAALLYWSSGQVFSTPEGGESFGLLDALSFSAATFATLILGHWQPSASSWVTPLATIEALFGLFLMALLVASGVRKWMR